MKRQQGIVCIVLTLLLIAGLILAASAAPSPILDFDLRQESGTTVVDSANGVVGTTHGTLWSTDPSGMPVLYFDNPIVYWFGDGDYFEIPYHDALNSPTMSIEALVYPMSSGYYTVLAERIRDGGTWQCNMVLGLAATGYHTGRCPQFTLEIGGINKKVLSPSEIPLNAWSHIVGTYDGNDMRLYVNGILVATEFDVGGPRATGSNPLYLGHAPTSNHYFNGFYAAFKLYDRALTAEEIGAEFTAPPVANANGPYLGAMGADIDFDGTASSDPDADPLSYDWDWGDTTASPDAGASPAHAYGAAGIYDVCLTVTDPYAASDTVCTYAVVYDPEGGFVTGGGWIDSPAGAYRPDPELTGQATFGFVSKYDKGAEVPTGNTEFQFHAADLKFHSSSYQWLVVTGSAYAKFKGEGTINDEGDYKFQIWAADDDPDTFRIRIWEEDDPGVETVIYDNGTDQALGSGLIIIHTRGR